MLQIHPCKSPNLKNSYRLSSLAPLSSIIIANNSPAISVIMPCHNAAATVRRAINSIQKQNLPDWELIVIDDGSTDQTPDITAQIAGNDPRINLVRQNHTGVAKASNTGFDHARAPIIARMDADDLSHPDRLQKQLDFLSKNSELGAVTCLANFAGNPQTAAGYAHHVDWTNTHLSPEQIALNRFTDLPFPHPTLMYRRELIEQHGGYQSGHFPEDYELILRWIGRGVLIGKVPETLYDWHDPPTRLSRTDPRYDPMAFHRCKAPYLKNAITRSGAADRALWLWGAGRPARKCAQPLENIWKKASGYIDIDPKKIARTLNNKPIVSPENLPPVTESIIISYVGTRGARDEIRSCLNHSGRTEGLDFWIAC